MPIILCFKTSRVWVRWWGGVIWECDVIYRIPWPVEVSRDLNLENYKGMQRNLLECKECSFKFVGSFPRMLNVSQCNAPTCYHSNWWLYLMLATCRNKVCNASHQQRQFLFRTSPRVSSKIVRNKVHLNAFYALSPKFGCWTSMQHDWSQVLLTAESRFILQSNKRPFLVCRERGTRNYTTFVQEISQYRQGDLMVCGEISIGGHSDLDII